MSVSLAGKSALVTGVHRSNALAVAVALSRAGAATTVAFPPGSVDPRRLRMVFLDAGLADPGMIAGDSTSESDARAIGAEVARQYTTLDALVVGEEHAPSLHPGGDVTRDGLHEAMDRGAWPLVNLAQQICSACRRFPRYIIGLTSTDPQRYSRGGDYRAPAEAMLETLCRYLDYRLQYDDVCVNLVRTWHSDDAAGNEFRAFADRLIRPEHRLAATGVGDTVVALCSGWMDAFRGQVLSVDRGISFYGSLNRLFYERNELGLEKGIGGESWPN